MTSHHRALDAADIMLIEKVKDTPTIYDSSDPYFKFAYRKEQLWENLAADLQMTAMDARRRWTCLRDRYSRELKQMRLHPERTEYGNNNFFRQMDFLRKFVRKRRERRRVGTKFKYDSSWDGSHDYGTKMHNRCELTHSEEHIYEETRDAYESKLEVSTPEVDEGYPEFVEVEGQISENYEDYEEQHRVEETVSPLNKYALSDGAQTPKHELTATSITPTSNAMPMTYPNKDAASATNGAATSKYSSSAAYKTSNPQQHHVNDSSMIASSSGPETEDDFFCKTIGSYLRQLSRRHKIKAKVEMFQILEKYIELEENPDMYRKERKG